MTNRPVVLAAGATVAAMSLWVQYGTAQSTTNTPAAVEALRKSFTENAHATGALMQDGRSVEFSTESTSSSITLHLPQFGRKLTVPLKGPAEVVLLENGKSRVLSPPEVTKILKDTGISLNEISFRFLFFDTFEEVAPVQINSKSCPGIKFSDTTDTREGNFYVLWFDPRSNAPTRFSTFSRDGKLVRRFDIIALALSQSRWSLKTIRITDIATHKVSHIELAPPPTR